MKLPDFLNTHGLPQTSLKKQVIDQSAHAAAALVIVGIAMSGFGIVSGIVAGAMVGIVREITEGGNIFSKGSMIDVAGWATGGGLAFLLFG